MALESFFYFPFILLFILLVMAIGIAVFAFWIWMIIDAAKRNFKNDTEKVVWILIIVLASWIGALIYYFVVRANNPRGLSKK